VASRISLAESAVNDLQEVRDWYVSQSASDVGERLIREILACLDQLAEFPESESGPRVRTAVVARAHPAAVPRRLSSRR
jgi:plasmid stabilization system protein ParE